MSRILKLALLEFDRRRSALLARCRPLREEDGSALVELGLMLSIVGVPLLLGTVYFAVVLVDSMIVANAAHAAAEYAMTSSTFAEDTANIITAGQQDAANSGLSVTPTITPSIFYACSTAINGTQYSTQTAANTACTGGTNHALEFVQVVATATVKPVGLNKSTTLTSTSIMEVEE
jgi:Flp pilus assembly protein TadG